jgi:hypothetical protein
MVSFIRKFSIASLHMHKKREQELLKGISELVDGLTKQQKQTLFARALEETIPVSIFSTKLSGLEAVVVYLKDIEKKSVKEISTLLKRKPSTIYSTYSKAKKQKIKLKTTSKTHLPLSIFSNRKYSILEILVSHLKESHSLINISRLLNKHPSTIKTTYWRYRKK